MAARVAGHWNNCQVIVEPNGCIAFYDALHAVSSSAVQSVHDALCAELFCELRVVRYVVAVRQEHQPRAAHSLYLFNQRASESRRVNQNVAAMGCGANNQIAPRAK